MSTRQIGKTPIPCTIRGTNRLDACVDLNSMLVAKGQIGFGVPHFVGLRMERECLRNRGSIPGTQIYTWMLKQKLRPSRGRQMWSYEPGLDGGVFKIPGTHTLDHGYMSDAAGVFAACRSIFIHTISALSCRPTMLLTRYTNSPIRYVRSWCDIRMPFAAKLKIQTTKFGGSCKTSTS